MPEQRREAIKVAIGETGTLWRNNHRYCSAKKLRAFFNRIKRYREGKEMLRENASAMIEHADNVIKYGNLRWQTLQTPDR